MEFQKSSAFAKGLKLIEIRLIMVSITRFSDLERFRNTGRWVLVYGRRKVGKSYFVRNFVEYDRYFFVGRSRTIFEDDSTLSYEVFSREVVRCLEAGKTVVIDEIQRLQENFFDILHKIGVKGRLIAISSTLWMTKELIGKSSPLLGLFSDFRMGLIDERDMLRNLMNMVKDRKKLLEHAIFLREPWLVPVWEKAGDFFKAIPPTARLTVPALIGEIFTEEERSYSRIYDAILKAVADGKGISTEIASQLYSKKLIPAQDPSLVHPYLKILESIGILEKVKVHGKNKYHYCHVSPVVDYFYYLDAKYGISEREFEEVQARKVLDLKIPRYAEQFIGKLLSKSMGLWQEKIVEKDFEIDIALTDFRKLVAVVEVKWKESMEKGELKAVEEKLSKIPCRRILFVPRKEDLPSEPEKVEVWDVETILREL
jgi:Holliday junction resolvase-like predicted endonuclease